MTSMDRQAMALALSWLRAFIHARPATLKDTYATDSLDFACDVLWLGNAVCDDILDALPRRRGDGGWKQPRILRVRLALLLRALLRADRGDFGPIVQRSAYRCVCNYCDGYEGERSDECPKRRGANKRHVDGIVADQRPLVRVSFTPLWERA